MRAAGFGAVILSAAILVSPGALAQGQSGLALVIGNSDYTGFPALTACGASSNLVGARLRAAGYEVAVKNDLSNGAMGGAVAGFAQALAARPRAPAIVYVCAYGGALNGKDFVLPVSAALARPSDLLTEGVIARIFASLATSGATSPVVVALDLVRDPAGSLAAPTGSLAQENLPPALSLAIAVESKPPSAATNFAAALAQALSAPQVDASGFLTKLGASLPSDGVTTMAGVKDGTVAGALVGAAPRPAVASPVAATPSATDTGAGGPTLPDDDAMTEADRKRVQAALALLGYYDGRIDGIFGADSRAAIRRWQHEKGVDMTGRLTGAEATSLVADKR
jgi:hypothetical protein